MRRSWQRVCFSFCIRNSRRHQVSADISAVASGSSVVCFRCIAGPKGVLVIVKNYTGDRLNFGMAIEQAKQRGASCLPLALHHCPHHSSCTGIKAMMVIVEDDCALQKGKGITGGRGIAGTIFVHKIAGAAAAQGAELEAVHRGGSKP